MPKVVINLGGREYPINCPEGQEVRLGEIAELVGHTMAQVSAKGINVTQERALMLACMTLADQLLELRDANSQAEAEDEAALFSAVSQIRAKVAHLVTVAGRA
jgi:cell division protein ZapA (FtsZ GTPase activity inhibitor)